MTPAAEPMLGAAEPALDAFPGVADIYTMALRAGLSRLASNALSALVSIVSWKTWDTQPYAGNDDDGASHSLIAERAGYSIRHLQRCWGELADLGVEVFKEGRKGRTNRYSIRKAIAALPARVRQRVAELVDVLEPRAQRNEGKRPIVDPDYEPPRTVPRGGKSHVERPEGPPWLRPQDIPEPWTAAHCVQLVTEFGRALFGPHADPEGIGGLWRLTRKLWKSRGYGDPEELARDVHVWMRAARECSAKCWAFELRGLAWVTIGGLPTLQQKGRNLLEPGLIRPGKLLAPIPFARGMAHARDHARGACSCVPAEDRPPPPPPPREVPALIELALGDDVADVDVDPHELWALTLPGLQARRSEVDGFEWAELALDALVVVGVRDGALVLGCRDAYERSEVAFVLEQVGVPFRLALLLSPGR